MQTLCGTLHLLELSLVEVGRHDLGARRQELAERPRWRVCPTLSVFKVWLPCGWALLTRAQIEKSLHLQNTRPRPPAAPVTTARTASSFIPDRVLRAPVCSCAPPELRERSHFVRSRPARHPPAREQTPTILGAPWICAG